MQFDRRTLVLGILFAGVAGGFLLLPALSLVGSLLAPSQPRPATTHVPVLVGEAIWARGLGGRATELQPVNPFTIARFNSLNFAVALANGGTFQALLATAEADEPAPGEDSGFVINKAAEFFDMTATAVNYLDNLGNFTMVQKAVEPDNDEANVLLASIDRLKSLCDAITSRHSKRLEVMALKASAAKQ